MARVVMTLPPFSTPQPNAQTNSEAIDEEDEPDEDGGAAELHDIGHLRNLGGDDVQVHRHGHERFINFVREKLFPAAIGYEFEVGGAGEENRRGLAGGPGDDQDDAGEKCAEGIGQNNGSNGLASEWRRGSSKPHGRRAAPHPGPRGRW